MSKIKSARRPAIVLCETDSERLTALAVQREAAFPELSALLLEELERATIRPDAKAPADVIRMGSRFEYRDAGRGGLRTGQLVYPDEADIAAGKVSVFTPIGAGLIGLRAGQTIVWPDRDGRERALTVVRVEI
ncbi:MAG: nucleoside diphosphate kinase regulator [Caulobacterales bacterium]|nr:nucleoside diphosphate kinase regulator [Caulobacterales bacterium]